MVNYAKVYSSPDPYRCDILGKNYGRKADAVPNMKESVMLDSYRTVDQTSTAEIVEKKSRFIGYIAPVTTEQEAYAFVEQIKKKHYDARHNCFAFSVGVEMPLLRFSDDGEPQGTAGKPILEVITGEDIRNICIVVTRYFGGTLLGTGGLVRAYTEAAKAALAENEIQERRPVQDVLLQSDYTDWGKLQYMIAEQQLVMLDTGYTELVKVTLQVPYDQVAALCKRVTELTSARAVIERKGEAYWA